MSQQNELQRFDIFAPQVPINRKLSKYQNILE